MPETQRVLCGPVGSRAGHSPATTTHATGMRRVLALPESYRARSLARYLLAARPVHTYNASTMPVQCQYNALRCGPLARWLQARNCYSTTAATTGTEAASPTRTLGGWQSTSYDILARQPKALRGCHVESAHFRVRQVLCVHLACEVQLFQRRCPVGCERRSGAAPSALPTLESRKARA